MRAEWIACALITVGCDEVWSIDHVDLVPDGTITPSVHDEDNDGVPDATDRCPGIADDQTDTDGDGVGDLCDPNNATHERIALFISFTEPASQWNTVKGTWQHGADSLSYTSVAFDGYGTTLYTGIAPEPPFVIDYHYAIDSIEQQGSIFSVLLDSNVDGAGVTCGFQRQNTPLEDFVRVVTADTGTNSEALIAPIAVGSYRVRATYDRNSSVRCEIISDATMSNGATTLQLPAPQPAGVLGFRSYRVGATLHYVVIYQRY